MNIKTWNKDNKHMGFKIVNRWGHNFLVAYFWITLIALAFVVGLAFNYLPSLIHEIQDLIKLYIEWKGSL